MLAGTGIYFLKEGLKQDLSRVVPSWVELSCIEITLDVVFEVDFKYILDRL